MQRTGRELELRAATAALLALAVALAACSPPAAKPVPEAAAADQSLQPWYAKATGELVEVNRQADAAFRAARYPEAAAFITQGQPIQERLLSIPRPTLAATEAVSDLDQLYGDMLLRNRHYGWARLLYQKNAARWKRWKPQTPDSLRRLKAAEDAMNECDRRILNQPKIAPGAG